ncbi:MAG: hypothetical protein A2X94_01780 [Bdellovibrionales bacterium GWB1_55_8]|nr:MAG: hypothetical protein A2X94_01780 [Bdellovibrionales bacterium GWB1_55_8]
MRVRIFLDRHFHWILAFIFFVILWRWTSFLVPFIQIDVHDEAATIASAIGQEEYRFAPGYRLWYQLLSFLSGSRDLIFLNDVNTRLLLALAPSLLLLYLLLIRADFISIFLAIFTSTIALAGMTPGNKNMQFVFVLLLTAFIIASQLQNPKGRLVVLAAIAACCFIRTEYILSLGVMGFIVFRSMSIRMPRSIRNIIAFSIALIVIALSASILSNEAQKSNSVGVFMLANQLQYQDSLRRHIPNWDSVTAHIPDFDAKYGHPMTLLDAATKNPRAFANHLAGSLWDAPFRTHEDFIGNSRWTNPVWGMWLLALFYLALTIATIKYRKMGISPWVASQIKREMLFEHFAMIAIPAAAVSFIYFAQFRYLLPVAMLAPALLIGWHLNVDLQPGLKRTFLVLLTLVFLIPPEPVLLFGPHWNSPVRDMTTLLSRVETSRKIRILSLEYLGHLLPFEVDLIRPEPAKLTAFWTGMTPDLTRDFDVICDEPVLNRSLKLLGAKHAALLEDLQKNPGHFGFSAYRLPGRESLVLYIRDGLLPATATHN